MKKLSIIAAVAGDYAQNAQQCFGAGGGCAIEHIFEWNRNDADEPGAAA